MKLFGTATTALCITLLGTMYAPAARADEWNRKTTVTFSGPVSIPDVHREGWGVLPAGTYVFKVMDSMSNRHIVQIFSQDEATVYATILAIPNYRLQPTDKTVITFRERAAGEPEAMRAWFYPGRQWGEEFVYSKAMAMELAKATNVPVLFTPGELPAAVLDPIQSADAAVVSELNRAPVMAVQPTGEEVQLDVAVTAPPVTANNEANTANTASTVNEADRVKELPATASTNEADRMKELPATASSLTLIAGLGLLALFGAFALRTSAKRLQ